MGECDWDGPGLVGGCGARWYDEHTWHGADLPVASGCMTVIEEDRFGRIWLGVDDTPCDENCMLPWRHQDQSLAWLATLPPLPGMVVS